MANHNRFTIAVRLVLLASLSLLAAFGLVSASATAHADPDSAAGVFLHTGVTDFWGGAGAAALENQAKAMAASAPTGVIDLWGGGSESVALRSDGTVWDWGNSDYGILGNGHGETMYYTGTEYDSWVPFQVLGLNGVGHLNFIIAIAGGEHHNVALDTNGEVWTWGWNMFGLLGNGIACPLDFHSNNCESTTPIKIPNFTSVKAIASRGYHTLALKNDGSVWAWGYNNSGRLGDGTNVDRYSPVLVAGLTGTVHGKVMTLSSGGAVSAALMQDHTLMAWGDNSYGAVGNGTTNTTGQWTPVEVSQSTGLTDVKAIATGWDHMVALAADGTVWTWGSNDYGELGNGAIGLASSSSVPYQISPTLLENVIGVSAGDGSTVVLKADGTVWAWGALRKGDTWNVLYDYGPTPVQVAGIDHITLIRARDWHVLALKSDGTVWAWGWNFKGQIGDGTLGGEKTSPSRVLFPDFFTQSLFLPVILR